MTTFPRPTLAAGAAWAVPTVLTTSAAPRVAASGPECTDGTLTIGWRQGTYVETTALSGSKLEVVGFTFIPTAWPGLTITGSTVRRGTSHGSGVNFHRNGTTSLFYSSSLTLNYNEWNQTGYANRTDWTISFSQAVTGLTFGIDWDGINPDTMLEEYLELVAISPAPPFPANHDIKVLGTGTASDPWRTYDNFADNDNANEFYGTVVLDYADTPVSSFTITAWSEGSPGTEENIFLSTLTIGCP
ncbi:MAG: hypothetical protein ACK5LS_11480 [Propioniciclava sp.]